MVLNLSEYIPGKASYPDLRYRNHVESQAGSLHEIGTDESDWKASADKALTGKAFEYMLILYRRL